MLTLFYFTFSDFHCQGALVSSAKFHCSHSFSEDELPQSDSGSNNPAVQNAQEEYFVDASAAAPRLAQDVDEPLSVLVSSALACPIPQSLADDGWIEAQPAAQSEKIFVSFGATHMAKKERERSERAPIPRFLSGVTVSFLLIIRIPSALGYWLQ
jgi:hypothetical protein